jgi:uncharacterized membrane protein YbhN (UPF0104 family)
VSFINICDPCTLITFAKFLISAGLGLSGFSMAFCLKNRPVRKDAWYTSLRYIFTFLSISAFSNAYSIVLLGYVHIQPTELFLNISLLSLIGWSWCFYYYRLKKIVGEPNLEKILKFLHSELGNQVSNR